MNNSVCIISLSNITHDSRVLRQVEFLSREYDLHVIGFGECPNEYSDKNNIQWHQIPRPKTSIIRILYTILNRFIIIPFFPRLHPAYKLAVECDCDVYHANNWDALPMGALAARKFDSKIVIDLHESYKSWYWGLTAGLVKYVLKKYAGDVTFSTTVVDALVQQHRNLGYDPYIIRNIPSLPSKSIQFLKTDPKSIKLVYHGLASPMRSTDLLIKTLAQCDKRYELHLILMNNESNYVLGLQELANQITPGRVIFYPPLKPQEIIQGISKFDVGFYPLVPKNYNNRIALPNKLFEFIAAGLAVCIGPSPSMDKILNEYQCGITAPSFEPAFIADLLNQTTVEDWDEMKRNSLKAAESLNAENEMQKLLQIYDKYI